MRLVKCRNAKQLKFIKALYIDAFPEEERKPFSLILKKSEEGKADIMAIEDSEEGFLGLAITVLHKDIVLLDYFAVRPNCRGRRVGSCAISLLKDKYEGKRLVIEIEDTEEASVNREERIRRKSFYLKNGMKEMRYRVWLFGVKMQILTNGAEISFDEYHQIFDSVFSNGTGKNVIKA